MAYQIKEITVRTNNSLEGVAVIGEVWKDIAGGTLPLLFDSGHQFLPGISPVSRYTGYASDENGDYDLTIMAVQSDFFQELECKVSSGTYIKYDESDDNGDLAVCTGKAWEKVWSDHKTGAIHRAFTEDFESTVPAEYTKDNKAHCYLYIALKPDC